MTICSLSSRVLVILLLSLTTTGVTAHKDATGIVAERMDAMKDMEDRAAVVADMVKGKVAIDYRVIQTAADALIDHATEIPTLFPDTVKSRNDPVSEALPVIWKNWHTFEDLSTALSEYAGSLKKLAAEKADIGVIREAFAKVADNCSTCHEDFRAE